MTETMTSESGGNILNDGLDLLHPDATTASEVAQFRAYYDQIKKEQNLSYEFWLQFRPDVLKRHKARTVAYTLGPRSACGALAALHQYIIVAFRDGIRYEMELARSLGATQSDVLDVISIAFVHSSHPGMYEVYTLADYLREFGSTRGANAFPEHWRFDTTALSSGMDYGSLDCSPDDLAHLYDWYERCLGEVPKHVTWLGRTRPELLKAYRNRYEHAIRDSLPVQMLPYLLLHYNVIRGSRDGIRENVLLASYLGMSKLEIENSICSAVLHAGAEQLSVVYEAAGDLLERLPLTPGAS